MVMIDLDASHVEMKKSDLVVNHEETVQIPKIVTLIVLNEKVMRSQLVSRVVKNARRRKKWSKK